MSKEKSFKTFREDFAYYDRTGMQEFLEQKASEGWKLVKKQFPAEWEFIRVEPQNLHYAITYLPQISNEDSFLLSENKKEYLELCAASGWQFVCAYKNMVIFLNEKENPLPLETDPEVELASIHKSVLKHSLPKTILAFALFTTMFFYLSFSDTVSKGNEILLAVFAVLSIYTVMDFCGYLRWHKKAIAAAATGEFSRTNTTDKLLSSLFAAVVILITAVVIVKSIVTNNWVTLIVMALIVVAMVLDGFLNKLKNKIECGWEKNLFKFVSVLIYLAAIACGNYIFDLF
ncbi:MAG: DUF2812 domain-containing protein [Clostridia bacterium]|nr:DUF2812 domain-containing protein [Clostridia bacterium]